MDLNQFAAQLEAQLQIIVSGGDGAQIRSATAVLGKQFYSKPESIYALMHILSTSPRPEMRQIAAVELRKRSAKLWNSLDSASQSQVKSGLLDMVIRESEKSVRNSVSRVISEIASDILPKSLWPELIPFIQTCCVSGKASDREVGFFLVHSLVESASEFFAQNIHQALSLFSQGLLDNESLDVKAYTLEGLGVLAELIDPKDDGSIKQFRGLISNMIACLQQFVMADDEDKFSNGVACFIALVTSDVPILTADIAQLLQFFLTLGANVSLSEDIRTQALTFVSWAAVFKKNRLMKLKLVEPIVQTLMTVVVEEEPEDYDEDSPSRVAVRLMNTLASNMPPQQVFPLAWGYIPTFMQNANPGYRRAAMNVLAAVSDGCSDYIRNEFKVVNAVPFLLQALGDGEISVRRAGLIALAALTSDMGSEMTEFHENLLPLIFNALGDRNDHIRKVALETLDVTLENMGDKIRPYLAPLMERLLATLDQLDIHNDTDNLITVISAIGSAAHASENDFSPFFNHVYPRLERFMNLNEKDNEEVMNIRVSATDAMSAISKAVGKDVFGPHLNKFMEIAMNGLLLGSSKLPEAGFLFFGTVAEVFGKSFEPYLGPVVEAIHAAAQMTETDVNADIGEEEDFTEEDAEEEMTKRYARNNAIAEEKEAAIDALGSLIEFTKEAFLPYFQQSLSIIQELCDHSQDGVRKASMIAMFKAVKAMYSMYHADLDWTPGVPSTYQVHPNVQQIIKLGMDEMMRFYAEEEEMIVIVSLNTELLELMKAIGPVLIEQHLDPFFANMMNLLLKKAVCQAEYEEEEEEAANDEENMAEYDALLISTTVDLLGTTAQLVGENFASAFAKFWPLISKYYRPNKPVADRSMAIGVIGEVAGGIKSQVTQFTNEMLPMVTMALGDEDAEVRSNAAFAMGNICQYTTLNLDQQYPIILQKLSALFNNQPMDLVVDNACGCVCRMIMARPHAVPLDQVIPIIIQHLPLKTDYAENEPVYQCISQLFSTGNQTLLQHLPQLFSIFAKVLQTPMNDSIQQQPPPQQQQLKPQTRQLIIQMLRTLSTTNPTTLQSTLSQLSTNEQQVLISTL